MSRSSSRRSESGARIFDNRRTRGRGSRLPGLWLPFRRLRPLRKEPRIGSREPIQGEERMKTGLMMASSVALCMMLGAAACRPAQKKGSDESLVSERTFKGSPNAGESQSGKIVSVKAVAPLARESSPDGYLAAPPDGKGRPVLVLHAWWGLNDTTRDFCRRLADAGFVAFAPDLYHGKVADTIADAETLARALDGKQARADIAAATRVLSEQM